MLTDTKAIGQRIRQCRKEKGLTQTELAEMIGKSLRTVQKYEKGEIEVAISVINDIAAALNTSSAEILEFNSVRDNNRGRKKKVIGSDITFATRLRELLEERKITQPMLAGAIGVSRQSVGQWKDGKTVPDVLDLQKIAVFFGVSADYLLGLSDIRAQDPKAEIMNSRFDEISRLLERTVELCREAINLCHR